MSLDKNYRWSHNNLNTMCRAALGAWSTGDMESFHKFVAFIFG